MLEIKTKIDVNGFWYFIDSENEGRFLINYFIVGQKGRFCSGEIKGISSTKGWQFIQTEIQPLYIGFTKFKFSKITDFANNDTPDKITIAPDMSRRKMIKSAAATLLFGGVLLNPLIGQAVSPVENFENRDYNPYSESDKSRNGFFSPYNNDYQPY